MLECDDKNSFGSWDTNGSPSHAPETVSSDN